MTMEEELTLYKTAFHRSTECGATIGYDGWGGPRRKHIGAEEAREMYLRGARKQLGYEELGEQP